MTENIPYRPFAHLPLVWMILSQLINLVSLVPWVAIAGLSFMAFDSGESPQAWAFVGTVLSYPLLPLCCSILAWVLWAFKKRRAALVVTSLPLAVIMLGVVAIVALTLYGGLANF